MNDKLLHTPGPWFLDHYGGVTANGEDVAHVVGAYGCVENEANARLIAAAPDLLAALRGLFDNSTRADWPTDLYQAAEAAIAKATPKAPLDTPTDT